jgi:hypothetical protein
MWEYLMRSISLICLKETHRSGIPIEPALHDDRPCKLARLSLLPRAGRKYANFLRDNGVSRCAGPAAPCISKKLPANPQLQGEAYEGEGDEFIDEKVLPDAK